MLENPPLLGFGHPPKQVNLRLKQHPNNPNEAIQSNYTKLQKN
jgi:hypothetical protein